MSLWGPAGEAEIEYRQEQLRKAWGGERTSGANGFDRVRRRAERRSERRVERSSERRVERSSERRARSDRAEQIKKGIAGMRPAATTRRGLFA